MTMDQSKIDPELAATQNPFVLSIEPCNRPVFKHGYHLGTDIAIARKFAEQTFTQHHDNGTSLYTVALMRDGKVFDVYDGSSWFSDDMEKLVNSEHGVIQLNDAAKAHKGNLAIPTLPAAYQQAVRRVTAIRPKQSGYALITESQAISVDEAWQVIKYDNHVRIAHLGSINLGRQETIWDLAEKDEHDRREIAAALVNGTILFW